MGKYDDILAKEYFAKKKEMFMFLGGNGYSCNGVSCDVCPFRKYECYSTLENADYEKSIEIVIEFENEKWSKVPKDTKVLVRDSDTDEWLNRYFAYYKNGRVWCYSDGKTSFTSAPYDVSGWKYAKLYKENEDA